MQKQSLIHATVPAPEETIDDKALALPPSRGNQTEMIKHRSRLKDLYFRYFNPVEFHRTSKLTNDMLKERGMDVSKIMALVKHILKEEKIGVLDIHGRSKAVHSTYRKLLKYDMDITRVYDLVAVRVLVGSVDCCYKALSALHSRYEPIAGRIKDYIVRPKDNGYQSLHTTVIGPDKSIFEVQFRTRAMHAVAEFGSAAHWLYDLARSRQMKGACLSDRETMIRLQAHLLQHQKKNVLRSVPVVDQAALLPPLRSAEYSLLD